MKLIKSSKMTPQILIGSKQIVKIDLTKNMNRSRFVIRVP